jgi:hypothetical protein
MDSEADFNLDSLLLEAQHIRQQALLVLREAKALKLKLEQARRERYQILRQGAGASMRTIPDDPAQTQQP